MIIRRDWLEDQPENNIPEKLKSLPWMGTRFERRADGKLNKPPYRVRTGRSVVKAGCNDPKNWATYEEALAALERGDVHAVGVVLGKTDSFTVVDLDDAISEGEMTPFAANVLDTLNSYTEVSISGTGLHIFVEATKPGADCRRDDLGVEVYDGRSGARFVVVTGNQIADRSAILPRQNEVERLYREWWPENRGSPSESRRSP